jgi:DNA-binding transcriptional regulator PaaX
MSRNIQTTELMNHTLRALITGAVVFSAIGAPGLLVALDKYLYPYMKGLDKKTRKQEVRRIIRNLKKQGLIKYTAEDYEHGLIVTNEGRKRIQKVHLQESIIIHTPKKWDKQWRMVFFDIPESIKPKREIFNRGLKQMGFVQLQRSVWVHPFPCKEQIQTLAAFYNIEKYITYIETSYIDNVKALLERFDHLFKK